MKKKNGNKDFLTFTTGNCGKKKKNCGIKHDKKN